MSKKNPSIFEDPFSREVLKAGAWCIIGILLAGAIFTIGDVIEYKNQVKEANKQLQADQDAKEKAYQALPDLVKDVMMQVEDVRTWYKYNESNINFSLSSDQLKEEGGVCWHYAKYYSNLAYNLGFHNLTIDIGPSKRDTWHEFALVYDDDLNYCLIDQTGYKCFQR